MIEIKSPADVRRAQAEGRLSPALAEVVAGRLAEYVATLAELGWEYDPDLHGHFVVLEYGDGARELYAGHPVEAPPPWEGVVAHPEVRVYEVVIIYGSDYGLTFFVPDEPWFDGSLRRLLQAEAERFQVPRSTLSGKTAPF